ncbi:unnamed protein product, partial [Iphiclides podalirius]
MQALSGYIDASDYSTAGGHFPVNRWPPTLQPDFWRASGYRLIGLHAEDRPHSKGTNRESSSTRKYLPRENKVN